MPRRRYAEDLTVEELRRLLIEKSRVQRQDRLESFRKTGRVIEVESVEEALPLDDPLASLLEKAPEDLEARPRRKNRTVLDWALMAVEGAAVVGLLFVVFYLFNILGTLNHEVSAALVQPTLTPTPIIEAVVLPSGHTSPALSNQVSFNEEEIPAHLRPLVNSMSNLPVPTAGPESAIRIRIPSISLDAPVVQGDAFQQLKKGVGQHLGSANPGQKGNVVLSAHNDVFGELFRYLDELKEGDQVILYTSQREYVYTVKQVRIVEPTQTDVMGQTQEPVVTLISCYPYRVDNQRIVVTAYLQGQ